MFLTAERRTPSMHQSASAATTREKVKGAILRKPSRATKCLVGLSVTFGCSCRFYQPPCCVSAGKSAVLRAGVPEAAIHVHGYHGAKECDIDAPPTVRLGNHVIHSVTQTTPVESAPQLNLRRGVSPPRGQHSAAGGLVRRRRRASLDLDGHDASQLGSRPSAARISRTRSSSAPGGASPR